MNEVELRAWCDKIVYGPGGIRFDQDAIKLHEDPLVAVAVWTLRCLVHLPHRPVLEALVDESNKRIADSLAIQSIVTPE